MKQIQITLESTTGKYKPVSTIIEVPSVKAFNLDQETYRKKAIERILVKRGWSKVDLVRYGYTKIKMRVYDQEQIKKENAETYEKIKEEKYASGEWKRPKGSDSENN